MDKSRTEILIGNENIDKIARKHITIVGVGGVRSEEHTSELQSL